MTVELDEKLVEAVADRLRTVYELIAPSFGPYRELSQKEYMQLATAAIDAYVNATSTAAKQEAAETPRHAAPAEEKGIDSDLNAIIGGMLFDDAERIRGEPDDDDP